MFLICITQFAAAKEPKRVISITPVSWSLGGMYVAYEEIMSGSSSISPSAGTVAFSVKDDVKNTTMEISLINVGFGYYFYPKKNAPRGFYCGPKVECNMINVKYKYEFIGVDPIYGGQVLMQDEAKATITDFEARVQAGYRWIWERIHTL